VVKTIESDMRVLEFQNIDPISVRPMSGPVPVTISGERYSRTLKQAFVKGYIHNYIFKDEVLDNLVGTAIDQKEELRTIKSHRFLYWLICFLEKKRIKK